MPACARPESKKVVAFRTRLSFNLLLDLAILAPSTKMPWWLCFMTQAWCMEPGHDNKRELPLRRSLNYLLHCTESSIP